MDINSHSSEIHIKLYSCGVWGSPAYSSIFLLSLCLNPASLPPLLLTGFFFSYFMLWNIRTFLHYYCENTYVSSSWSTRKNPPFAIKTRNRTLSCLRRFQCQARCEQRNRYKVIRYRQVNSMRSWIYLLEDASCSVRLCFFLRVDYKQLALRIR